MIIDNFEQEYLYFTDRKSKHRHYCHHHCHHAARVAIPWQSARVFEPNAARCFDSFYLISRARKHKHYSAHDAVRMRILLHFNGKTCESIQNILELFESYSKAIWTNLYTSAIQLCIWAHMSCCSQRFARPWKLKRSSWSRLQWIGSGVCVRHLISIYHNSSLAANFLRVCRIL